MTTIRALAATLATVGILISGTHVNANATDDRQRVVYRVWGDAPRGVKIAFGGGNVEAFVPVADTPWRTVLTFGPRPVVFDIYAWPRKGRAFVTLHCSITVNGETFEGVAQGRAYDRPACVTSNRKLG